MHTYLVGRSLFGCEAANVEKGLALDESRIRAKDIIEEAKGKRGAD